MKNIYEMTQGSIRKRSDNLQSHKFLNKMLTLKCETIMKKFKVSKNDYNATKGNEDQRIRTQGEIFLKNSKKIPK